MFISFWTFKTTSLGGLNAAANQTIGIYNRLSEGEANAGLWALGGSGVGQFGFHLTTATGAKNAALRNSFRNDPEGQAWNAAFFGMSEFTGQYLQRNVLSLSETVLEPIGFFSTFSFIPHSLETMMEAVPASAELWKKAGCQSLHLSATQGSGMGNFSFNTHFENEADYGAISDRLNEDEAWRDWQAKYFGTATWTGHLLGSRVL